MKYFRKQFPVTTFCSSQLFPPNPLSPVVEICKFFSENLAAGSPNLFLRYNNRQFSKLLCSFNSIRWNLLSAIMPIILDVQFALNILHWNILYFYCPDEFWFLDIWEFRYSQLSLLWHWGQFRVCSPGNWSPAAFGKIASFIGCQRNIIFKYCWNIIFEYLPNIIWKYCPNITCKYWQNIISKYNANVPCLVKLPPFGCQRNIIYKYCWNIMRKYWPNIIFTWWAGFAQKLSLQLPLAE